MSAVFAIERPRPPVTVWLLSVVTAVGLLALGIAAFFAFSLVQPWYQALFSAFLIEVGAIVEAIALIRGNNWIAAVGLVFSLAVSGTYNYTQASTAGAAHGLTDWWQLSTLAAGPLGALTFLAMTLGHELRGHEKALAAWQEKRQAWILQQQEDSRRLDEKTHQDQEVRSRQAQELELEKEKLRLQNEAKIEIAKYRAQIKADTERQMSRNVADTSGNVTTFSRGYPGFVEYLSQLEESGRTFDKHQAAKDMNRSVRMIERYISDGSQNGAAELLDRLSK